MAAQYTPCSAEIQTLIKDLIDADPINLSHVDSTSIVCVNKEEKKPKAVAKISQIKEPFSMLTNFNYLIEVSEELANKISQEHLELHLYTALRQINNQDGKIKYPDVIEFRDIADIFGYDWKEKNQIDSIFSVLENQ